jgi:hypothetical protein
MVSLGVDEMLGVWVGKVPVGVLVRVTEGV